jgi:hypothetical protein
MPEEKGMIGQVERVMKVQLSRGLEVVLAASGWILIKMTLIRMISRLSKNY